MSELRKKIHDDNNGLDYVLVGDYYLPVLSLPEETRPIADLYDPLTMPPELLKAHNANNRAVMEAYGFSTKMSEADCVAELMKMYQKLTEEK